MAVAPGLSHYVPLPYGHWRGFLRDPLGFQIEARERFGDVFRLRLGPLVIHFLYHPDHVRHVLAEHPKNYVRGFQYRLMAKLFGQSLTLSEGPFWLRQRRLAQPAFHRQRLSEYAQVMVDAASELVSRWRAKAPEEQTIEARREMSRVTLAITSRTLFDRDAGRDADEFGASFAVLGEYFDYRFNNPISAPPAWVPTATNRRFKNAVAALRQVVAEIVRQRRQDDIDRGDLLSMLIHARDDETGEKMTEEQLRNEMLNFLLAGYETTATALTWTLYLLAAHTSVRRRVREEVHAVIGARLPTAADARRLHLTHAVLLEAMRLYPPIWIMPRQVVARDEISGFRIPARSLVMLCPYITHRHPEFWKSPAEFDPGRFSEPLVAERHKGAYFPFLCGPHQCIGNEFAMLEMKIVIARILQDFDLTLASGQNVKPVASLGLWPDQPVWLGIHRPQPEGRSTITGV